MQALLPVVLAFAFSQILLSVLLLLRTRRSWSVQQWLFLFFLAAIGFYLAAPVVEGKVVSGALTALSSSVPGLFWLFCASIFDDHFRLRAWQLCLVMATVVLPQLFQIIAIPTLRWLFVSVPQILEFVLLSMAIWVVSRSWRGDLIESRRSLRLWYFGFGSVFIFALLLFRELVIPEVHWLAPWQFVSAAIMLLITNMVLLDYKSGIMESIPALSPDNEVNSPLVLAPAQGALRVYTAVPGQQLSPEQREILSKITDQMENQHTYRQMGLTIGQLASALEFPEYRLRKLINSQMGYRNFTDFLNNYRIQDACERLLAEPGEAVLNIALDAGYRSLSSFNKAFKSCRGQTPTEYRAQARAAKV